MGNQTGREKGCKRHQEQLQPRLTKPPQEERKEPNKNLTHTSKKPDGETKKAHHEPGALEKEIGKWRMKKMKKKKKRTRKLQNLREAPEAERYRKQSLY